MILIIGMQAQEHFHKKISKKSKIFVNELSLSENSDKEKKLLCV